MLVADDADIGAYYRVTIPKNGRLIDLNKANPVRVRLKSGNLAIDLESVDLLADGRVALLSERLRALVGDEGILAEYDRELAELGGRGLEGLAVRPLAGGGSRIAVLWEGGYTDQAERGGQWIQPGPFLPLVFIHDLPKLASAGRVRLADGQRVELKVPVLPGREPEAQRFRAPDLVWCKLAGGEWGFLVLLSSQNQVNPPVFRHKWLARFDLQGNSVGEPLDLGKLVPAAHRDANWEGLAWFDAGRSVVLAHEGDRQLASHAFVLDLPKDWQFTETRSR
jgi:hypothetical protein